MHLVGWFRLEGFVCSGLGDSTDGESRRSTDKRDFWQLVFQEYANSGLSIRAFCEREGLSEPSFYAWRKRLTANETVGSATASDDVAVDRRLIPVRIVAEDQSETVVKQSSTPRRFGLRAAIRYGLTRMLKFVA